MSDESARILALLERIATPGGTPSESYDLSEDLDAYGHIGDALRWLGAAQSQWPPLRIKHAVVVCLDTDARRTTPLAYATLPSRTSAADALLDAATEVERAVDAGADLIVVQDPKTTDPATMAVVALLTGSDASSVMAPSLDSRAWMESASSVRDAMRDARILLGDLPAVLDTVGAYSVASLCGALLAAAARRTPVILDSTPSLTAALVAARLSFRAREWWSASQRPAHPAASLAIDRLDLHPFMDLHLRDRPGYAPSVMLCALDAAQQEF